MCKTLKRLRFKKANAQDWHCHYCDQPMWGESVQDFAKRYGISARKAAGFQCTAEHLMARQDGGRNFSGNIVAACKFCNQTRHTAKQPRQPADYKALVSRRIAAGKWNRLEKNAGHKGPAQVECRKAPAVDGGVRR